ncbi:MAG: DUF975 family protein [Clostridia bacterium]|nr:DUF975 family protein [Clostridia bacterium]
MRPVIPAYEFRRRAREAMKPVMNVFILVTLIAMLPGLIGNILTILTDSDPSAALMELYTEERMTAVLGQDAAASDAAVAEISGGMGKFLQEKWPFMALNLMITLLFGPVLGLGFHHACLRVIRRQEISVGTVLERLPLFFKAIGLEVTVALKIFLWMLPGLLLTMAAAVVILLEPTVGALLLVAAMAVYIVLMVRAMFRYHLAPYIIADEPACGIRAAIRRSAQVMKGRKLELFGLQLSFVGWRLLLSMGQTLLLGMLGSVLGMALGMFASVFLQMYMYLAEASFYQAYAVGPVEAQMPEAEDLAD